MGSSSLTRDRTPAPCNCECEVPWGMFFWVFLCEHIYMLPRLGHPRILERAVLFSCGVPGWVALSVCWGLGLAGPGTHVVILRTSFMLMRGSELSGHRRRQGAKMMASALGDMRFTSSSRATLCGKRQLGGGCRETQNQSPEARGSLWGKCCRRWEVRNIGFCRAEKKVHEKARPPETGSCLGMEPAGHASPENATLGLLPGPHPPDSGHLGHRHLLDQVEDEPLQGVVVGFWQVLQDGVDGSQLLLLLWEL